MDTARSFGMDEIPAQPPRNTGATRQARVQPRVFSLPRASAGVPGRQTKRASLLPQSRPQLDHAKGSVEIGEHEPCSARQIGQFGAETPAASRKKLSFEKPMSWNVHMRQTNERLNRLEEDVTAAEYSAGVCEHAIQANYGSIEELHNVLELIERELLPALKQDYTMP